MKRISIAFAAILLFACSAVAQRTVVSGTVTDSTGVPYSGGTLVVTLSLPLGASGATLNGVQISGSTQRVTLDNAGSFLMQLPDNAVVLPGGTQWTFAVNISPGVSPPLGTGPQSCTATLTITGASQSVSAALSSCPRLSNVGAAAPNTPSPLNVFSVKNYGAIGDAKKNSGSTTTNGGSHVTNVPNAPYLSTDVGKKIFCIGQNGLSALTPTIATITAFNSTSDISVSSTGNANAAAGASSCIWYTQKETTAFAAAYTASGAGINQNTPFNEVASVGTVYCPPGGYVLDGPAYVHIGVNANTMGGSFRGAGKKSCRLYYSPDVALLSGAWIVSVSQTWGTNLEGFSVDCSLMNIAVAGPGIKMSNTNNFTIKDVEQDGCGTSGDSTGQLEVGPANAGYIDGYTVNAGAFGSPEPALGLNNCFNIHVRNMTTTNPGNSGLNVNGCAGPASPAALGPRSTTGGGVTVENSTFDEGGVPGAVIIQNGSSVNLIGVTGLAGTATVVTVTTNSSAYITDSNFAPFNAGCSGGTRQALTIAANSAVYSTGSDYQGCGSDGTGLSAAVSGPAGALFADLGGNTFRNCTGSVPCPLVTPAQYPTLGFNGGIVPKATVTHTPNTCYAVTGNLLATAQNICTFLNDQNYQVLNITAQSGGTTPANSACATPPVITLSDGTRTATLTMTTGKTQWSSAVDASTVGSVFATGTTLTISIGANTCATPPVNVAVSYILQSVLNP